MKIFEMAVNLYVGPVNISPNFWHWAVVYQEISVCILIPHPELVSIPDWSKSLGGFTVSRMSRAGGRNVVIAMHGCGISMMSQTHPVCKHRFSSLPIDKTSVEAKLGLFPRGWIQIAESRTRGVVRMPLRLKPSRVSCATSPRDSAIWIQPLSVFHYKRYLDSQACVNNSSNSKTIRGMSHVLKKKLCFILHNHLPVSQDFVTSSVNLLLKPNLKENMIIMWFH